LTARETNFRAYPAYAKSKILAVAAVVVIAALCLAPGRLFAFNKANLDSLLATGRCEWCDLSNADLSREDLPKARLSNANLSGANLSGADLSDANLNNANLNNANLKGANLTNAFLKGAYLRGANLSRANLQNATLDKANLQEADLTDANLSRASLAGTTWTSGRKCEDNSVGECVGDPSRRAPAGQGIPF